MFSSTKTFNKDISCWNVSNFIDMSYIIKGALLFNKDISCWNISNVKYNTYIFLIVISEKNLNLNLKINLVIKYKNVLSKFKKRITKSSGFMV